MTQPTTNCAIGDRPHPARRGLVCGHHFDELGAMLRSVEDEAIQLEVTPSLAIGYDQSGGGLASQTSPVRLGPSAMRDRRRGTGMTLASQEDEVAWDDTPSALETLHARARTVREERYIAEPTVTVILGRAQRPAGMHGPVCARPCGHQSCGPWVTDTVRAPVTLTGERDLLTRQLPWIAEQSWVDEFHEELRVLLAALRRANNTTITPVGRCDSLQPHGSLCDGQVWHVVIGEDGQVAKTGDGEPGFRCGRCRRVWTGTDAVRKRDQMWRDEQARKAEKEAS